MSRISLHASLTVRQAAALAPACAEFLGRFPSAKIDGRWALQSLARFALRAGTTPDALVDGLSHAAGVPRHDAQAPSRSDYSLAPVLVALIAGLTLGAGWGVGLLLRIALGGDYGVVPAASVHVHGVAQLWGWMTLFIFAVAQHVLRQNTLAKLPRWLDALPFALIPVGLLAFFLGILPSVRSTVPWIDLAGSALLAFGALLHVLLVALSIFGRRQRPMAWHAFVLAAAAWLVAWAISDLVLRWVHRGAAVLPDAARTWLILVPVLGFATNAIYGFGIRLLPGLLNLTKLRASLYVPALALHNAGLIALLTGWRPAVIVGAAAMLAGSLVYLAGLRWLRGTASRPIFGVDFRNNAFLRLALLWLPAGLAMVLGQSLWPGEVHHAYAGAWRHALTVGFVTTMILAVGHRILPIFLRQPLASNRMMLVSLSLVTIGNAWRVGFELLTIGEWTWAFRLMGVSGLLELTAITLFGINVLMTWRAKSHHFAPGDIIRPHTRVAEAVDVDPALEARLRRLGVRMLDDAPFVAPSMTFGAMALAVGWDPDALVARLAADGDSSPADHDSRAALAAALS